MQALILLFVSGPNTRFQLCLVGPGILPVDVGKLDCLTVYCFPTYFDYRMIENHGTASTIRVYTNDLYDILQ